MKETDTTPTDHTAPARLGRANRLTRRLAVTLGVAAASVIAVQYGAAELTRRAEAAPAPEAAQAIPVSAVALQREAGYEVERAFIGQVEPQKTVAVSFELAGQLASLAADEGDTVRAGQVLATQDTALLEAERARLLASKSAAEAQLRFAVQTLERAETLSERGFATRAGFDGALAERDALTGRIAEIEAAIATVEIRIGKSHVTAPFDGRVTSRFVDGGEALGPGQAVLELVELSAPRVRVGVPLGFDAAALGAAAVEVAGEVFPARLVTLRPDIDPVTRTRTAIFAPDTVAAPAFGQTARLMVRERVEEAGLWVPLTSLQEGVRGQWTLLTVDAGDTVRVASVELLHAESDRAYVRGAFPEGTRLIGAGPQRVTAGQRVTVISGE